MRSHLTLSQKKSNFRDPQSRRALNLHKMEKLRQATAIHCQRKCAPRPFRNTFRRSTVETLTLGSAGVTETAPCQMLTMGLCIRQAWLQLSGRAASRSSSCRSKDNLPRLGKRVATSYSRVGGRGWGCHRPNYVHSKVTRESYPRQHLRV